MRSFSAATAAKILLGALWLVCLYRAATQSLVHDEALTWQLYVLGPAEALFSEFSSNHHFLNSLLMRLSAAVFGHSEWALRLPSLGAAALYFYAAYRLTRRILGENWRMLLALALLSLNPLILDFLVAARGYGLAIAFLLFAIVLILEIVESPAIARSRRDMVLAGCALGLSVMANLVFVLPAAVVAVSVVAWVLREGSPVEPATQTTKKRKAQVAAHGAPSIWLYFCLPIAAMAMLFLTVVPIERAESAEFYVGAASIGASLRNLAAASLQHRPTLREAPFISLIRDAVAFGVAPLTVLLALAAGVVRRSASLLIPSIAALGSGIVLVVAHASVDLLYPVDRTGIYFLLLVALCLIGVMTLPRPGAWAATAVAAAATILFAIQFNTRSFMLWPYDAETQVIAQRLAAEVDARQSKGVRVVHSWQLEPTLNYYRIRYGWAWTEPFARNPINPGGQYYLLIPEDHGFLSALGLKIIYRGAVSDTVLAKPAD